MADERNQMAFKLPPDQMRRLERAAQSRRQTKQTFVAECVLAEIASVEEHRRLAKLPPTDDVQRRQPMQQQTNGPVSGLGIGNTIRQQKSVVREAVVETAPSPVVVHVGSNGGTQTSSGPAPSDLERLAVYVMNGDEIMRDMRQRTAVEVLTSTATTPEEKRVLVARLDEIIASKENKQKSESENDMGGIVRGAKLAFDKLASLIQGE